jgi:hypothetical protein
LDPPPHPITNATVSAASTSAERISGGSAESTKAAPPQAPVTSEMLLREELVNIREKRKLTKEKYILTKMQQHYHMLKIKQKDPFFDMESLMSES